MHYTTLEAFKAALDTQSVEPAVEDELTATIEAVSRAIDRYCTRAIDSTDYFLLEDVENEILQGRVSFQHQLTCHPKKPIIHSIAAASYRYTPAADWVDVDPSSATLYNVVKFHTNSISPGEVQVRISYNGGLAEDTAELPADFVNAATILCVRFYKEVKSGLGDSIGVAELGTMVYTKAWPIRVVDMLTPFRRVVPWT